MAKIKINRVILIVLDSVGVGSLPDAAAYGDEGANTLGHVAAGCGGLRCPTWKSSGWATSSPLAGRGRGAGAPGLLGAHGRSGRTARTPSPATGN